MILYYTAGLDYTATTSSLVLNPRSTVKFVYVDIIDDNAFERSETFFGHLSAAGVLPQNIYLEPSVATATIIEDKRMCVNYVAVIKYYYLKIMTMI